jgi:hypothetical protein
MMHTSQQIFQVYDVPENVLPSNIAVIGLNTHIYCWASLCYGV